MDKALKNILFLDIETVSATEQYSQLEDRLKAQWARKASFLRREDGQTDEDLFHQKAGIYAEFGKIVSVAIGILTETATGSMGLRTKHFTAEDEHELLLGFSQLLNRMEPDKTILCAHNGKEFDFPYLSRRMLINGIPLPAALNLSGKKPWEIPHVDTLELWKFGDYKHYTSLDLLTAIFNIPTSKGTMNGSQVNEVFYKERDLPKIAEYCTGDVIAVAQLYLRMKGLPLLQQENIIQAE